MPDPRPAPDTGARVDQLAAELARVRRELLILSTAVFLLALLAALDRWVPLLTRTAVAGG